MYTNELIFFISIIFIAASLIVARAVSTSALMCLLTLQVVLMNLFITKQITLFGLNATSSDALGIGAVLGINLLREYGDSSTAAASILISFLAVLFYTGISWLHLTYIPCLYDTQQQHFIAILEPMPRILIASLISYFFVQMLEYWLYGILKKRYNGRYVIVRNYAVLLFTQLIDTVLFTLLGLYGIVDKVGNIIIISYAIKVVTIIVMTPLVVGMKNSASRFFGIS